MCELPHHVVGGNPRVRLREDSCGRWPPFPDRAGPAGARQAGSLATNCRGRGGSSTCPRVQSRRRRGRCFGVEDSSTAICRTVGSWSRAGFFWCDGGADLLFSSCTCSGLPVARIVRTQEPSARESHWYYNNRTSQGGIGRGRNPHRCQYILVLTTRPGFTLPMRSHRVKWTPRDSPVRLRVSTTHAPVPAAEFCLVAKPRKPSRPAPVM
jgi:hypothetical protein